jgi:hypothetical protein
LDSVSILPVTTKIDTAVLPNSGKRLKNFENKASSSQLSMYLNVDDVAVTDKEHMAELFKSPLH